MKKLLFKFMAVLITLVVMVGCSEEDSTNNEQQSQGTTTEQSNESENNSEQQEEASVHIKLSQDKEAEVIEEKDIVIEDGDTLMDVLKANFEVEEKDGYVNSIEGINDKDKELKKFWMISVNGKAAEVGANDIVLKDGDEVVLDFQSWE
ncbi:DUF4430 domain-containing protein [Ornithinibacillus xuwenensis]|uniref:DUF4430 domain-containing protein n=1 Tax=Ornithinibacillus xuwenensis TaxID=3144668 RepID=A0ABU9XD08_9BACI